MKKKIIILSGDPNSINSELIYKSWKKLNKKDKDRIFFVSNYELIKHQFKKLKYKNEVIKVDDLKNYKNNTKIKIINIKLNFSNPFKVPKKNASKFVLDSLNTAHKLALLKDVAGIINCPISKRLLTKEKQGVTEYLADKNGIRDGSEAMLIKNESFSVCPLTTHIDIKDVSKKLSKKKIIKKIITVNKWFRDRGNKKPKIGVLGLNPHNAELRKNSEERKIILPAINSLRKKGINVKGPLVADTIFIKDYKKYNVLFGMYHDQVLAPLKQFLSLMQLILLWE